MEKISTIFDRALMMMFRNTDKKKVKEVLQQMIDKGADLGDEIINEYKLTRR